MDQSLYYEVGVWDGHHDPQGEAASGSDRNAWCAMNQTAWKYGAIPLLGEEDEFRKEGLAAPKLRGERIKELVEQRRRLIVADSLDGSNQAAAMAQRSAWGSCGLLWDWRQPTLTAAIKLGDGRAFYTTGEDGVWYSESTDLEPANTWYEFRPGDRCRPTFPRQHWIVPASKAATIAHAQAMIEVSKSGETPVEWISPLGGSPGIVSGLLTAGAIAAKQPESYAWDGVGVYICAAAGLPTISAESPDPLSTAELSRMFMEDLKDGRKTQTLYVGRTLMDVRYLREVDLAAGLVGQH